MDGQTIGCEISLDNDKTTFHPGDEMKGVVKYTFPSMRMVRGIKLEINGQAHTAVTIEEKYRDNNGQRRKRSVLGTGNQYYIGLAYYLIGAEGGEISMAAGEVSYPFKCVLPNNIPCSYVGKTASIRYIIRVTLEQPFAINQTREMIFRVVTPYDLNVDGAILGQSKEAVISKKFYCCCCASKPVYIMVKIPVTGFVPGQTIPVAADCDNASNVNIEDVVVTLRKTESIKIDSPRTTKRVETFELQKQSLGSCAARKAKNWNTTLTVPMLPPSNMKNCDILNVTYDINIRAKVSGVHLDLAKTIDITIGTIPLRSFDSPVQNVPETRFESSPDFAILNQQTFPASRENLSAAVIAEQDAPPPSYEECLKVAPTRPEIWANPSAPMMKKE